MGCGLACRFVLRGQEAAGVVGSSLMGTGRRSPLFAAIIPCLLLLDVPVKRNHGGRVRRSWACQYGLKGARGKPGVLYRARKKKEVFGSLVVGHEKRNQEPENRAACQDIFKILVQVQQTSRPAREPCYASVLGDGCVRGRFSAPRWSRLAMEGGRRVGEEIVAAARPAAPPRNWRMEVRVTLYSFSSLIFLHIPTFQAGCEYGDWKTRAYREG